ncbi:MAG: hypothetical protein RIS35_2974 [Pseudomonadota bacterium]
MTASRTVIFGALLALAGCAAWEPDVGYYWQSASGHLALLARARPIDDLVADPSIEPRLKSRLLLAREIRAFAATELALPDNGSYTRYVDVGAPSVVWNVFATAELSLELRRWCFPVAGCVAYRGYFDRQAAERAAESLRAEGLEAFVAGIPAYSTLGWFDDPVLSTFLHAPDGDLARMIFHELAHQLVYLRGDTTFNESFATAVEQEGLRRWLALRGDPALERAVNESAARRRQFVALLLRHRAVLEAVYREGGSVETMRSRKAQTFESLRQEYAELKTAWGGYTGFDRWFGPGLTNAHLASVSAYHTLVPAFERRLAAQDGDLTRFYADVRALARMSPDARRRALEDASGPIAGLPR